MFFYRKLPSDFCSGGMGDPPRSPRIPFTSPSPQHVNSSAAPSLRAPPWTQKPGSHTQAGV